MTLHNPAAQLFIPDGRAQSAALGRSTALCVAAHQDDIEIMAYAPIIQCYGRQDRWFAGVVVTDGAGAECRDGGQEIRAACGGAPLSARCVHILSPDMRLIRAP